MRSEKKRLDIEPDACDHGVVMPEHCSKCDPDIPYAEYLAAAREKPTMTISSAFLSRLSAKERKMALLLLTKASAP
jgi:hypothetical protein